MMVMTRFQRNGLQRRLTARGAGVAEQALEDRRAEQGAAQRAGRSSTILTTAANRGGQTAASGVSVPYGGTLLGGS